MASGMRKSATVSLGAHNQTLESLMITPVQRIPRYILLLKEIIKHGMAGVSKNATMRKEGAGGLDVRTALQSLEEIAKMINDSFRLKEARERVVLLDKRLKNLNKFKSYIPDCVQNAKGNVSLVHQTRYHVKEGVVEKKSRHRLQNMRAYNDRYLILFNDLLIYASVPSSADKGTIDVRNVLTLNKLEVDVVEKEEKDKDKDKAPKFRFRIKARAEEFVLRVNSANERAEWVAKLEEFSKTTTEKLEKLRDAKSKAGTTKNTHAAVQGLRSELKDLGGSGGVRSSSPSDASTRQPSNSNAV